MDWLNETEELARLAHFQVIEGEHVSDLVIPGLPIPERDVVVLIVPNGERGRLPRPAGFLVRTNRQDEFGRVGLVQANYHTRSFNEWKVRQVCGVHP